MDIVACIAVIVSGVGTLAHVYFDYKKSKQTKDIIWDTALQIVTKSETYVPCSDLFMETYEELKAFHDNGCKRVNKHTPAKKQEAGHAKQ